MKVALLQCNTVTGDVKGNAKRILQAVRKAAAAEASLCVTPELALCGVSPQALLFSEGFIESCRQTLQDMATQLKDGPAVLVGAPVANATYGGKQVTNAAVLLQNGTFSVVSRKVFHSQHTEGDEWRYFERGVSCGLMTIAGWRLGIVICEDNDDGPSFWNLQQMNAHNPLMELVSRNVDGIIHMASNAYVLQKQSQHEHTLSHAAARHHIHLFSANMVGGNDGVVYAGQSVAFGPTGNLLTRGRAFEEDLLVVDTATGIAPCAKRSNTQEEECWGALVLGTGDYVRKSGMHKVFVGLSGGIDSALVAAVAVEALGKENVHGVLMPSPHTSQDSLDFATQLAKNLGIAHTTIAIEPLMQAFSTALDPIFAHMPLRQGDVTFENVQARIRATLLMSLANREGGLVLNTGNKSECAMGYCTLYGDAVGALAVIGDLSKTMVYRLAQWYNTKFPTKCIPESIITRPPTAELRPDQLDSDSIPPYAELDPIVEQLMGVKDTAVEEKTESSKQKRQEIFTLLRNAEFKRRQEPLAIRVTDWAFGIDWHIPVVSRMS